MTRPNFTEEFKIDAIKQITERGYSVADVSKGCCDLALIGPLWGP